MKNKIFVLFKVACAAALFISCWTPEKHGMHKIAEGIVASGSFVRIDNPNIVTIDNRKVEKLPYAQFAGMIEDVRYIPLISQEPIAKFRKVLIHKERIYVLDTRGEKIFIFNMQGKIIKVIDSRGGGPEEYQGLSDMIISLEDDYLVINDRLDLFILYFTLDGEFVKKTRSIPNSSLETVNGKVLYQLDTGQSFDEDVNYMLVVTDGDSIVRKGYPHYPIQYDAIVDFPFSRNYRNELLFCPYYCDTVYQIINDSAYTVRYTVRHTKSFWERSNEKFNYFANDYARLVIQEGYTVLGKPILETERFVYHSIHAKQKFADGTTGTTASPYWYDKEKEISFTFESDGPADEPIYHFILGAVAIYGDCFAGIISNEEIEYCREYMKEGHDIYKGKLKDVLLDENPDLEAILMLYKFKSE
jgi:hypothetical protein